MSTINHDITDAELRDLFDAGLAVFDNDETKTEDEAIRTANDYAYAVFRNLFTAESYRTWLSNRARNIQ